MIGVLGVIAILAAVMAPSVIRRVDRAAWTKETADLNSIADSYTAYILRSKTIPSHTNSATIPNWASAVASQMSLPVSSISTNARRYARAFLIDTNFVIGGASLPYSQTTNGTTKPVSARVMIVSSLGRALPISTGIPTSTEFNAIWNTAEGAKPATATWTNWAGSGDDLRIKKLNLEPLFYQLILVDHTGSTNNVARYSIDSTNSFAIPLDAATRLRMLNAYFLDSTTVGLLDASGQVQARHLLKRSISFIFEADAWRGQIQGDQQKYGASGSDFYNHAVTFFNRPTNPWGGNPQAHGASQWGVMISMYTFMFDYTYWANECPHFDRHGNNNLTSVPEYTLLNNQGQNNGNIDRFSKDLTFVP